MNRDNMPSRIRRLPIDHRGFPVPWFVQWMKDGKPVRPGEGEPDFRIIDSHKLMIAVKHKRCWVCGDPLGINLVFSIGPMCAINRVISEPPSHRDCAEFSVKACPFLSRPRMRRNEKDLPENRLDAPGFHLERNPGAVCLWTCRSYRPFHPEQGGRGVLFQLGSPVATSWWAEGRAATRGEVLASIEGGLPHLLQLARSDGPEAVEALKQGIKAALPLLPFSLTDQPPVPTVDEFMTAAREVTP